MLEFLVINKFTKTVIQTILIKNSKYSNYKLLFSTKVLHFKIFFRKTNK